MSDARSILELIRRLPEASDESVPIHFRLDNERDRGALRAVLATHSNLLVRCDRLLPQIQELLKSRRPGSGMSPAASQAAADDFLAQHGGEAYGTWVYYPWRRMFVRLLPQLEFVELRTSRNRYKITASEQARLANATIGIVGLSAGNAIAVGLALERVGARFRLADHDSIELSNMNRVGCGVTVLGTNKSLLTARQLYEIDPYLEISAFTEGIGTDNIAAFLDGPPKLDLLIEECDDLYMKVRLREEAKQRGIAVLMETNDRGLLDVERFDLEPSRPLFHGLLAGTRSDALRGLDTEAKTPFMLRILGTDMSSRLAASLIEIDKTIVGWPQLGSGNILGAAIVTDTARRILLGQLTQSGRYNVELERLIGDASAAPTSRSERAASPAPVLEAPAPSPSAAPETLPSRGEIEWIVAKAATAPSGGNDQPWRFVWRRPDELECYLDRARSGSFLDYECCASFLALGAAAENALIAACGLGRHVELVPFPDPSAPDLAFKLTLHDASHARSTDPLLECLDARVTNRRLGVRRMLESDHARILGDAARERGAELTLVTDPNVLDEVGHFLGAIDRFRFLCERLHTAMMSELRWTTEEAVASRDGIDVGTLELDPVSMAGLRLLANEKTASFLRSLGQGARLEKPARRAIEFACAVGLLSVQGSDANAHFEAGRAVQRVWLWATRLGLAFQPMSVAPYLFLRLTHGAGKGFTKAEIEQLGTLHERFIRIFGVAQDRSYPLLFRLTHAPTPSVRALRRQVAEILTEV